MRPVENPARADDRRTPQENTAEDEATFQRPSPGSEAAVKLNLSPDAQKLVGIVNGKSMFIVTEAAEDSRKTGSEAKTKQKGRTPGKTGESKKNQGFSDAEQAMIEELRQRDTEVRGHEAAHFAAAGGLAKGGPKFVFQTGPDKKQYAIGGSVEIDTSPVPGNPEATLAKGQKIRQAAMSVGDPSSADAAVAMAASEMTLAAQAELGQKKSEESPQTSRNSDSMSFATGGMAAQVATAYSAPRSPGKGAIIKIAA